MTVIETPVMFVSEYGAGNKIYIKREDLYPLYFGGNKVRIAQEFFADMDHQSKTCIIGYGNARSNMTRAIANISASRGVYCIIVSSADEDGNRTDTLNNHVVEMCGAEVIYCEKTAESVSSALQKAFELAESKGYKPYYIYGDIYGKGNEATPVNAYFKVYQEINRQSLQMGVAFDYIFLATGTGMTQSGLLAGKKAANGRQEIIGISVARRSNVERDIIKKNLRKFGVAVDDSEVTVIDEYVGNGYGIANKEINTIIDEMIVRHGIALDPTYTGKAYNGMLSYIEENNIKDKNIMFIHTGGTPLFYDYINLYHHRSVHVERILKKEELVECLRDIDFSLPEPLSRRVDISVYAKKILTNGHALGIFDGADVVGTCCFYCNDLNSRTGYLTLLAVKQSHRGCGYSTILLEEMERVARKQGMKRMELETDKENFPALALYSKYQYEIYKIDEKLHLRKDL